MDREEWVPLVDENGNVTGKVLRDAVHNGSKLLHPVVHMHVLNFHKEILLQKRPVTKFIQPGKWDTAVGGHISAGEVPEQALQKEAFEEIGLQGFSPEFLQKYKYESDVETELVYLYITYESRPFQVHSEEVDEVRFWKRNEIEEQLGKGVFTPNFEFEFNLLNGKGLV